MLGSDDNQQGRHEGRCSVIEYVKPRLDEHGSLVSLTLNRPGSGIGHHKPIHRHQRRGFWWFGGRRFGWR